MDRGRIAEFVVSCVLPADRAEAVTGDFLEEAESRGGLWFWGSVFRTVAARIANDFRERPLPMLRMGVFGFLQTALFPAMTWGCFIVAVIVLDHTRGHSPGQPLMVNTAPPGAPPYWEPMWAIRWTVNIGWAVWLFQCGRWAARKIPGLELTSGIAIAAIGWAAILAWEVWTLLNAPWSYLNWSAFAWHDAPLLAGAVIQRQWRMAHGS